MNVDLPPDACFRDREWKRFVQGPDRTLLEELYEPGLARSVRYDRCCAYFSSTVLSAAARGFASLIRRLTDGGSGWGEGGLVPIRLVTNEQLQRDDVLAILERGDLSALEERLLQRLTPLEEALGRQRLEMLAWMADRGLLEIRVGLMRQGEGIVHTKFGIMTDARGDGLVFAGSGNETARALGANYESVEVSTSWADEERYRHYCAEFEKLWTDSHPTVHTLPLPEAIRAKLIEYAPEEPPVAEPGTTLARQKAAMLLRFVTESPYLPNGAATCDATTFVDLWPHQRRVVEETASAWPDGRLLCDEVGMGKTIEAICALRRLMAGRGVRRVLLLAPAGLTKQWQGELREKGGLYIPRLEAQRALVWPGEREERVDGLERALRQDFLIMSRETARLEHNQRLLLAAEPWDLVLVDEAHAARRREQVEGEFNSANLLLGLLRNLQFTRQARSLMLLSATPMQTQPWEPWDLLSVLGEGGLWLSDFGLVRDYYEAVATLEDGSFTEVPVIQAARLVAQDEEFPPLALGSPDALPKTLRFTTASRRARVGEELRSGAPLGRRMHRNTRETLRRYYEQGRIDAPPPNRQIEDVSFDYETEAEREAYEAIEHYINSRFAELEQEKPGKGFVMTIYRRRAASSPVALRKSLERRATGLMAVIKQTAADPDLGIDEIPAGLSLDDLPDLDDPRRINASLPEDPETAQRELAEINDLVRRLDEIGDQDTKRDRFLEVLREVTGDGRPVLVFTEYTDTMDALRSALLPLYGGSMGCYSGRGGEIYEDSSWRGVSKAAITERLRKGRLRVLLCTDAASEGLNLQAAGAIVNYDLPWNPSRVEQRIGRIDRIGQAYPVVYVRNLLLEDSIDQRVYQVLRERCGLFERFVGTMQPVLARAQELLMGRVQSSDLDLDDLEQKAREAEGDPLTTSIYTESLLGDESEETPPVTWADVTDALGRLSEDFGLLLRRSDGGDRVSFGKPDGIANTFGLSRDALEADEELSPLSLLAPGGLAAVADGLVGPGEQLPLVITSHESGPFRVSLAHWVGDGEAVPVETYADLRPHVDAWSGAAPDPEVWRQADVKAKSRATDMVRRMEEDAAVRQERALARQLEAAKLRLQRETGRYLLSLGANLEDLNASWYRTMQRQDVAARERLRRCMESLGEYPDWDDAWIEELRAWSELQGEREWNARRTGREVEAALADPRWRVGESAPVA